MKYKIAFVKFDGNSKRYQFKLDPELELVKKDKVVVNTVRGLQIATVMHVRDYKEKDRASQWVVEKIDTTNFNRLCSNEAREIEIIRKLRAMEKERKRFDVLRNLALCNKDAYALVQELEIITGNKILLNTTPVDYLMEESDSPWTTSPEMPPWVVTSNYSTDCQNVNEVE